MAETTLGDIRVYRENGARTRHFEIFELSFDSSEVGKYTFKMVQHPDDAIFLELDLYEPTQRHIDNLEKENARLEKAVEGLEDKLDDMAESLECLEDLE